MLPHDTPAFDIAALDYHQPYKNREVLEAVLNQIPDGVVIAHAKDGEILSLNRVARQSLGIAPANAPLKLFSYEGKLTYTDGSRVPPEQLPLTQAFRGESLEQQEYLFTTLNGQVRYHRVNSGPLRSADGSIVAGILVFRDYTEEKRIEDVLQQSERRYRQVFESASDGIYTHDLDGKLTSANQATLDIIGYPLDELLRMNIGQLIAPSQLDETVARHQKKLQGEALPPQEVEVITKTGDNRIVEASSSVLYEDGKAVGMQGMIRDVTERRHREKEIGSLQERFSKAFQASPYPLGITRVQDGRYLDVNDAALRQSGYSREEFLGRTGLEIGLLENAVALQRLQEAFQRQGSVRDFEVEFITKTGEKRVGLFSANPIEFDGETFILSSIIDITEQRLRL